MTIEKDICEVCEIEKDLYKSGICKECYDEEATPEYDCEYCEDTGEVDVMEYVWKGDPHMAPTGTRRCPHCCPSDDDYDDRE